MPLWSNWAGDQRCAPHLIVEPVTEEDVASALADATDVGRTVRVAGTGHSFTDIVCTDDHMLRLGRMARVLDSDSESGLARVQAGISLNALGRELEARGLSLENQGDVDPQTLAGAIATATHGTGAAFGNIGTRVEAIRMVLADGTVVECSPESDRDLWLAARVGLGALGVVTELTVRCVPLFSLRRIDEPQPLDEVLGSLESRVEDNDHWEAWVLPYSRVALTRRMERLPGRAPVEGTGAMHRRQEAFENTVFGAACRLGRAAPRLIPRITRAIAAGSSRTVLTDVAHRVFANRRDVRFTEMEYAIPAAAAGTAVERVVDMIERRRLPVGFPIELRVVAPDDAWLSTAHGRETAYIAVHQYTGMEFESYFRSVEEIMLGYGGRPHWGKRHYQSAATLRGRYPCWDDFARVRERVDPGGLFRNGYLDRVLGPVRAEVSV
jgi:L-gulonolactone oxidase